MGCNCNKVKSNGLVDEAMSMSRAISQNENDWVEVIYMGASYPHYIPSPTGVIKKFGIKNYGLGKRGDKLKVHTKEIPSLLFKLIDVDLTDNESLIQLTDEPIPFMDGGYTKNLTDNNMTIKLSDTKEIVKVKSTSNRRKK